MIIIIITICCQTGAGLQRLSNEPLLQSTVLYTRKINENGLLYYTVYSFIIVQLTPGLKFKFQIHLLNTEIQRRSQKFILGV